MDSCIAGWMECVTVNIIWKILHAQVDSCIAVRLECVAVNIMCTAQQMDSGISVWMECDTVNIMWKLLHSRWKVVFQVGWSVLQ